MRSLAAPRAGLDASSRKRTHELLQSLLNSFVLAFEVLIRDAPKRHQAPSLEPVSPAVRPLQLIHTQHASGQCVSWVPQECRWQHLTLEQFVVMTRTQRNRFPDSDVGSEVIKPSSYRERRGAPLRLMA
jgi:hypothetical protein